MDLKLFVVDDDELFIESLKLAVPDNWAIESASTTPKTVPSGITAALVDMHLTADLSNPDGLSVIEALAKTHPHLEVIACSGEINREKMEQALLAGASRFLAKPLNPKELEIILKKLEALIELRRVATHRSRATRWLGESDSSQKIRQLIAELSREEGPILIEGESGTGKEVSAQLLHQLGGREPLISVNVAAIPENLFESEFFGHVKGAFTGADSNKMGLLEAADGGDLFLDEIEALPLSQQVKLLRFLETGEVRKVGGQKEIKVKTRVIAATNQNLEKMVAEKEFREDLLWRLNGKKIILPPLRDRLEDLSPLAQHFFNQDAHRKKTLGEDALVKMKEYHWPGNVRELKRLCEQMVITAPLPIVRAVDVEKLIQPAAEVGVIGRIDYSLGLNELSERFESEVIQACLNDVEDIEKAAQILKISRSSLYKKIKDYGIDWRNS